ncbi:MAG: adenine deaminase, partial [Syntrophorhabdus sp.]
DQGIIVHIEKERYWHDRFILPGFIDSHVHIESSMLTPAGFSRIAVVHGTVAIVCDPHEIANVLGVDGVHYMMQDAAEIPFTFAFGAPSCVPASPFETSGAHLGIEEIQVLLRERSVTHLSEMMNYPAVINGNPETIAKIDSARKSGKPVDGHAPGLHGDDLRRYVSAGISTDHESFDSEEAREKIGLGMKILIREGSAVKNFAVLYPLIDEYPDMCMFCTDDLHPDSLIRGHINTLVHRALRRGIDVMKVLRCACLNPINHYRLDVGCLRVSDPADMIVVDTIENLNVLQTIVRGNVVAENGVSNIAYRRPRTINKFVIGKKRPEDFGILKRSDLIRVIDIIEGQLVTDSLTTYPAVNAGEVISDVSRDILKIAVINRYSDVPPAIGFIRGFKLNNGAIASSIAHDCHNIIAVGVSDQSICEAVNLIIEKKGGISLASEEMKMILPLPIAGIMSDDDGYIVAEKYRRLNALAGELGCGLDAPFMTLAFMALAVIPK